MKKTIFLLALILPVCSLVAQPPVPTITLGGNLSLVGQAGNGNDATVVQTGVDNYSLVNSHGDRNTDVIVQTGTTNYSYVDQATGNDATVVQTGYIDKPLNVNYSWIEQGGNNNSATVVQDHNGLPPTGTVALEAYIDQSGNGNTATQLQGPDPDSELGGLWAKTVQSGDRNTAVQQQHKHDNKALVWQTGDGNSAVQVQDVKVDGDASFNNAFIWQDGNNNQTATQVQNGGENWAVAIATGNGNSSTQVQGKQDGSALSDNGIALVLQGGDRNDAVQTQAGEWNIAGSLQTGNGNESVQA